MKRISLIAISCFLAVSATAAQKGPNPRAVTPPVKRMEALKRVEQVLAPRAPTWKESESALIDPFFRTHVTREPTVVAEPVNPVARPDLEVLEAAANNFNPTGTMMVDGENYLLLGGKRYKTGAELPVTLGGIVYTIVISAIEGKSYTLRLNEQELRRQLK